MISWKDAILIFSTYSVHSFNTTSNSWSVLNEWTTTFYCLECILLPKNQVLVLSQSDGFLIFDTQTNSWEKLENSKQKCYRPSMVNLNGRFFCLVAYTTLSSLWNFIMKLEHGLKLN